MVSYLEPMCSRKNVRQMAERNLYSLHRRTRLRVNAKNPTSSTWSVIWSRSIRKAYQNDSAGRYLDPRPTRRWRLRVNKANSTGSPMVSYLEPVGTQGMPEPPRQPRPRICQTMRLRVNTASSTGSPMVSYLEPVGPQGIPEPPSQSRPRLYHTMRLRVNTASSTGSPMASYLEPMN